MCESTVHITKEVNEDANNTLKAFYAELEQLTTDVNNLRHWHNVALNRNESEHEDLYEYLHNLEYAITNVNQMHGSLMSDVLKLSYRVRSCKQKSKLRIKIEKWIKLHKDRSR